MANRTRDLFDSSAGLRSPRRSPDTPTASWPRERPDSSAEPVPSTPIRTRRVSRLLGAAGVLGALGGVTCGATMLLPLVGVAGAAAAAGSEAGTMAGMGSGPAPGGVLGLLTKLGPELLALSALLVVVSLAIRRWSAAVPAALGGAFLYWGMYAQKSGTVMYAALGAGFAIWMGAWVWARSESPGNSCTPAGAGWEPGVVRPEGYRQRG